MFRTLASLCFSLLSLSVFAQMVASDGSTRYGNEWINYDQSYLQIKVAEDGMYRISASEISTAGLSGDLVLHHNGEVVPLSVISDGSVVFYGEKNRGEMDRHLWPDPDANQLNDRYSMHTDTAAYYLTTGSGLTYQQASNGAGTPSASIFRSVERVFSDHMTKNYFRSGGISIYYSHYDKAEGFGQRSAGDLLSSNGQVESTVELALPASNGQQARLEVRFGTAFGSHEVEIGADGTVLATPSRSGWGVIQEQAMFTPNGTETTISLKGISCCPSIRRDTNHLHYSCLSKSYEGKLYQSGRGRRCRGKGNGLRSVDAEHGLLRRYHRRHRCDGFPRSQYGGSLPVGRQQFRLKDASR